MSVHQIELPLLLFTATSRSV